MIRDIDISVDISYHERMKTYNPRQHVELFHLLFLNQLGRKIDKKLFVLKGGCNMRFYFHSIRYSEDMDLDIQTIAKETLLKNVNQILSAVPFKSILQANGLEILGSSAPKQTDTTQRWKILLKTSTSALPLNTKIEFSRRDFKTAAIYEMVNSQILSQYSLPPIMSNHYSIQDMYDQKILALALRSQVQSRDIFDLYLLINSGVKVNSVSPQVVEHLSQAISNAQSVEFEDFKAQVLAYLPEDYKSQYDDPSLWSTVIKTVVESLDAYHHAAN